jgi:hypothetical protein
VADPSFREQLIELLHNPTPKALNTLGLPELAARVRRDPTWWRQALHKAEAKLPTAETLRLPPEAQQQLDRTLAQLARMERTYLVGRPGNHDLYGRGKAPPTRKEALRRVLQHGKRRTWKVIGHDVRTMLGVSSEPPIPEGFSVGSYAASRPSCGYTNPSGAAKPAAKTESSKG